MTESPAKKQKVSTQGTKYHGYDHVHFYVGNAFQTASYFVARFGFEPLAYKGLETGSRDIVTHVVKQGNILFAFSSALNPTGEVSKDIGRQLAEHGDGVRDVAYNVENARSVYQKAVERGAKSVSAPQELKDEHGSVVVATISPYSDTVHTFIERKNYKGIFLPGFKKSDEQDPLVKFTHAVGLQFIDHVVSNQPDLQMLPTVEWYEKILGFHRFWSVDENMIHTEYSALRSTVMTDDDEVVKMPINEPAPGKRKSQIQEFCEYYGGPGIQHIALRTSNIIEAVSNLRARGVKFLSIPSTYYENLRERLKLTPSLKIKEDLNKIQELHILVDFDDKGYLLQIFTKPIQDRPTVFLEIIQRANHAGFGAGNFKALFESIELEQQRRGNLTETKKGVY